MESYILEINLISAQGLKPPSANVRRMQTYALAWVDPDTKLRTRIDRVGGDNPTWNDKFLFRVNSKFLSSEVSGVSVEIYAVGCLRDPLIGTVRFLVSNFLSGSSPFSSVSGGSESGMMTPFFTALQIRRPSGRFHGILNIGAMVINGSDFATMSNASAIGYRHLMGRSPHHRKRLVKSKSMPEEAMAGSCENLDSCGALVVVDESGEDDVSDGCDSSTSSSSNASTPALKDWNGIRDLAGKNHLRASSDGGGMLCGLLMQRKYGLCSSNQVSGGSQGNKS